jgi:NTP pyrophosphatase (non-canonical NTP hydrolase)
MEDKKLTFEEYAEKALEIKLYDNINIPHNIAVLSYLCLCLTEESSELSGKLKRVIRDKGCIISDEDRKSFLKELGDVQWGIVAIMDWFGFTWEELSSTNLDKIQGRVKRGTLNGSGDER